MAEDQLVYSMNCPNAALNFCGIGIIGLMNLSDAFYEQKLEEKAKVFDKFYGLFSQEVVGTLKLEESILVPSSLHIFSHFFDQIGYGSDRQKLAAQMSVLGARSAVVAIGFL